MTLKVLLTGFGPFPGAPSNPTGELVERLARLKQPALEGVPLLPHVFHTSYETVDRDLPRLLTDVKPDALLMFGLSATASCLRIEMRARNVLAAVADADGALPSSRLIVPGGPTALSFGIPGRKLALAACEAGAEATTSRNAGNYLCNYLSWRAIESAARPDGPRFAVFIHVPPVGAGVKARLAAPKPWEMADLLRGAEAILLAAVAETRRRWHMKER